MRTYADEGRSGLRLVGREALLSLINDVRCGRADFEFILVYDVSRWGRFQDADESAYSEFNCKEAGIRVLYCAEEFENDGSFASTMQKFVKRAMAAEFSRDLSKAALLVLVLERRNSALMLPKLYVVTIDELLDVFHRGLIVGAH